MQTPPPIWFSKAHPDAKPPMKAPPTGWGGSIYPEDNTACYDLVSVEDVVIHPGITRAVDTGLILGIPSGWWLKLESRSGLAFKQGLVAVGGVIDADYRQATVKVLLHNNSDITQYIKKGDRIAQCHVVRVIPVRFVEVEEVPQLNANREGFGSTGK